MPVSQIPECRPRDRGIALGGLLAGLEKGENLVSLTPAGNYEGELLFATQNGLVKRTACAELNVRKSRFACISLKGDDRLAAVLSPAGYEGVLLLSRQGMAIHFALEEVSLIGRTAAGVKGMNLSAGDKVAFCFCHNGEGEVLMVSELGYLKRCLLIDFDRQSRGGKGVKAFNFLKNGSNGTYIAGALTVTDPYDFDICQTSGAAARFNTDMVEIESRAGRGSAYVMVVMDDFVCGLRKA